MHALFIKSEIINCFDFIAHSHFIFIALYMIYEITVEGGETRFIAFYNILLIHNLIIKFNKLIVN